MSMRAIWKGHVRVSLLSFPVKVYKALDEAEKIGLNLLHANCGGPVGYDKKCKKCEKPVQQQEIEKGYNVLADEYVIITKAELESVKIKSTKIIDIQGFISASQVPLAYYEEPYFIGPDGTVAQKGFRLLMEGLKKAKKVGVAKLVLRDREETILLSPEGTGLVFYKLRSAKEIRNVAEVPGLSGLSAVTKDELALIGGLIDTMETNFAEVDTTDHYTEALRKVIEAKVAGKEIVTTGEPDEPVSATADIMGVLKQAIEASKSKKTAPKKKGGRKAA